MKKSVNSNIYGYALDSTWERYGDYLSGAHDALVCIVSERPLGEQARDAFEKSFAKLGYGENACTYVVLAGAAGVASAASAASAAGAAGVASAASADGVAGSAGAAGAREGEAPASSGRPPIDLFALIEGLDPLVLVAADAPAAEMLGQAYRAGFDANHQARLFGRSAISFSSFEVMLASPADKQRAWALLKRLAR